ncbi:MAG: D-alanine--D-serine ligase VanG [Clostridium sp.]|nr:D-alanine--D-serine ligase VanG [Clostridium sp.]
MSYQKKIAVVFGDCSPEYSVSLQSAYAVINHMDKQKYIPVLIGITRQGDWRLFNGNYQEIISDTWYHADSCMPVAVSPSRSDHALLCYTDEGINKIPIDAAFPVLHGKNGEDGTVQGIFELAGIPVIGCGVVSSALCMDKDRAHKLVQAAGIAVPKSYVLTKSMDARIALSWAETIGYPLFVKPVKAGSSFGVTKVSDCNALPIAIKQAFQYDDNVIIEENIEGFEVGCAVMGTDILTIGEVDEIELADGFFDYTEKYSLKTSSIHVPARISKGKRNQIRLTAQKIYRALDCRCFARVDMFLSTSGEIVFNEVNTIPGFTLHSRFPNMMKAEGFSFEQIIENAIEQAVKA